MNINDYEALENMFAHNEGVVSDTMKDVIRQHLTYQESKDNAFADPFKWFYEDIIEDALRFDFSNALGGPAYASVSVDAEVCLHLTLEVRKIELSLIFTWVSAALKTIDHVVIHYLQEYLKEVFVNVGDFGQETSRYMQLAEKPDPLGTSGVLLKDVYSVFRNADEHRTKKKEDGTVFLKQPDKNRCRQEAIKYLKKALKGILDTYKVAYPHLVIAQQN